MATDAELRDGLLMALYDFAAKDALLTSADGHTTVFKCACGREQAYAPEGEPGGVTIEEAVRLGWTLTAQDTPRWTCPICRERKAN